MLTEVTAAVDFIAHIISLTGIIPKYKIDELAECLGKLLETRFDSHWFPQKPFQGSAYRCIRITQLQMDSVIEQAGNISGIQLTDLRKALPQELTMWIDPNDVSYRIGEDGSICEILPRDDSSTTTISNSVQDPAIISHTCHSEVPRANLVSSPNGSSYAQCWS